MKTYPKSEAEHAADRVHQFLEEFAAISRSNVLFGVPGKHAQLLVSDLRSLEQFVHSCYESLRQLESDASQ